MRDQFSVCNLLTGKSEEGDAELDVCLCAACSCACNGLSLMNMGSMSIAMRSECNAISNGIRVPCNCQCGVGARRQAAGATKRVGCAERSRPAVEARSADECIHCVTGASY